MGVPLFKPLSLELGLRENIGFYLVPVYAHLTTNGTAYHTAAVD